jgi:hypothetical protein
LDEIDINNYLGLQAAEDDFEVYDQTVPFWGLLLPLITNSEPKILSCVFSHFNDLWKHKRNCKS